jgi:hypothetical protein
MINYRKQIIVGKYPSGDYYIDTDRGDRHECFAITNTDTPWTKWWEMQDQSDLRLWQKDIMRTFASKINDIKPYVVYKKNQGYNQPHDIAMCYSETTNLWLLATKNDFWIVESNYGQVDFPIDDSLGSVLDRAVRDEIWKVYDALSTTI